MSRLLKVGITHGDINGIGYEVILKTFADERMMELCTPVLFGSSKLASYYKKALNIEEFRYHVADSAADAKDVNFNIVNITDIELKVEPGVPTEESGRAARMSLDMAMEAMKAGEIDVLVTAPINKKNIQGGDFHFPGHTEYLAAQAGDDAKPLMILTDGELRVALLTTHLPVREVSDAVTVEAITEKVNMLHKSLVSDFASTLPRIAILGLNPHCGDDGVCGTEEHEIIKPAIEQLNKENIMAFGPYAADGFFGSGLWRKFDAVLAMYHDQGLAPMKVIGMDSGINFTANLPFVRTSPDHGTAFDIAGKGLASPESFRQAVYAAIDIYRNRTDYQRATRHPLHKQYVDRGGDKVVLDLTKEETLD